MQSSPQLTMRFALQGNLVVYVNRDRVPGDAEWSAYYDAVEERARSYDRMRFLVLTAGGAPSPKQRRRAAELAARVSTRSAVVTDSLVARSIVTAFSWLKVDMKAFAGDQLGQACAFLELSPAEQAWATTTVSDLQGQLAMDFRRAASG